MKRYIIFIFLLFSIGAGAQVLTKNYTPYEWMQGQAFSYYLRLPTDTLPTAPNGSLAVKNGVVYMKWGSFQPVSAGGVAPSTIWGGIGGTLANQIDLQAALNAKQNSLPIGTTAQYLRGNLTLGNWYTELRKTLDTVYLKNTTGTVPGGVYPGTPQLVPPGGQVGYVLKKVSNNDWDYSWLPDNQGGTGSGGDETDPVYSISAASGISSAMIAAWNVKASQSALNDTAATLRALTGTGGVTSFNSRTGAVIPQLADYSAFFATSNHTHLDLTPITRFMDSIAAVRSAIATGGTFTPSTFTMLSTTSTLTIPIASTKEANYFFTGSVATWTLPTISGSEGSVYHIKHKGTGTLTISGNLFTNKTATTLTLLPGDAYTLKNDGTHWSLF